MTSKSAFAMCVLLLWTAYPSAQVQTPPAPAPPPTVQATVTAERSEQPATLTLANRPIVTLRAHVLGRDPADRVGSANRVLDELIGQGITGQIGRASCR